MDSDLYCGGYNIQIAFIRGYEKCLTDIKAEFSRGDTLVWNGSELGNCRDTIIFDDFTTVQISFPTTNPKCIYESLHDQHCGEVIILLEPNKKNKLGYEMVFFKCEISFDCLNSK